MTIKNIPVGYKDSPLGIIPMEWEVKRLGEVCNFHNGRAYKQDELLDEGLYKVLRVGNFFTNTTWYYSDLILDEDKYAQYGDLLYAWSASFGPRFWFGEKIVYHYHIWKIDSFVGVTKSYLYNFLLRDATLLQNQLQGGTMSHITKSDMEKRLIPLPPLAEQEKIAEILSTWDKAIEKQTQLIQKLELRKKGLMQQLLTGKKRLPGFTDEWKKVKLGEISKRVTRKNDTNCQNVVTISAQKGFVRQTDFFNKIVASKTTEQYYLVKRDEFCYNKSYSNGFPMGAIKRLVEFEEAVVTTLYICFVIESDVASIDFIEQYFSLGLLNNGLRKVANEGGRAHGLLNVTPYDFFDLKMFLPSLQEQTAIANILSSCDEEIRLAQGKLATIKEQKKGLMQVLLTGKRSVKL